MAARFPRRWLPSSSLCVVFHPQEKCCFGGPRWLLCARLVKLPSLVLNYYPAFGIQMPACQDIRCSAVTWHLRMTESKLPSDWAEPWVRTVMRLWPKNTCWKCARVHGTDMRKLLFFRVTLPSAVCQKKTWCLVPGRRKMGFGLK